MLFRTFTKNSADIVSQGNMILLNIINNNDMIKKIKIKLY